MKPGRELLTGGHAACLLPRGREFAAGRAKLGPSRSKTGPLTSSWQAGGASSACCRVRAPLLLLFPCFRVVQGCHHPQLWSLCPAPALLGLLDVTRFGYKPAQLLAVPGAGGHGSALGREVTLAATSPTSAPAHPPHWRGLELAGGTRLDGEQLDTASSCHVAPTGWQRSQLYRL